MLIQRLIWLTLWLIFPFQLVVGQGETQIEQTQRFDRLKYDIVGPGNNTGGTLTQQYWKNEYNEFHHQIGLNAGFTTGFGVSYRYWPERFGNQITFFPYKNKDYYLVSIGYTGLVKIHEIRQLSLFGYISDHILITKARSRMNLGIGLGFEVYVGLIGINLMYGYGFYNLTNNTHINLTGELGVFYRF